MPHANEKMRVYCLGMSCAHAIWNTRAPNLSYVVRVADQLFMTAAHESHLVHRRQVSFVGKSTRRGAWSLYQVEWESIEASLRLLARKPAMAERALNWLAAFQGADLSGVLRVAVQGVGGLRDGIRVDDLYADSVWCRLLDLMLKKSGDPLGCLFARLHYLQVPAPIPSSPEKMADYAKEHYNTAAGKATPQLYLDAFRRMCPWPPEERF